MDTQLNSFGYGAQWIAWLIITIVNTFLYGAFTKLNAPYNDLQTEDKIKIPIYLSSP